MGRESEKNEKNEKSQKMFKLENDLSQRVSVKIWSYKRHLEGFLIYFSKRNKKTFFDHFETIYSILKTVKKMVKTPFSPFHRFI